MKFPLRLSLDLWGARLSQHLATSGAQAIFHLPAAMLPTLNESGRDDAFTRNVHSAADSVRTAVRTKAAVLWIGGGEPLDHSEVGRVTFALNGKGRNVFLHTDGQRLRRRIHEFRPDPRLFLTVELAGREKIHDASVGRQGAFSRAIEGVRAAKLSGFHVCVHVTVNGNTDVCDTGLLFEYLDRYDVDGFVVSSGGRMPADADLLAQTLADIRQLVRCSRWENFSRLLEVSYATRAEKDAVSVTPVPDGGSGAVEESA
jgi:hypothetical protein